MKLRLSLLLGAIVGCALIATTILASDDPVEDPAAVTVANSGFTSTTYVCHHPPGQRNKSGKVKKIVILLSDFDDYYPDFEQEVMNHLNNHEGDCYTGIGSVNCETAVPYLDGGYDAWCDN